MFSIYNQWFQAPRPQYEEMGRTLHYCEWKQSSWLSLQFEQVKSQHPPSADVQHRLKAYAHCQVNIY